MVFYRSQFILLMFLLLSFPILSQSWQTLNATTFSWRFEDMQFLDPDVGWVVDGGGQILKTTNGGVSWTQQFYNSAFYFRSVEFYNDQIGFAGTLANGSPTASLFRTIDGGLTWSNITPNFPQNIPGICGMHMTNESTIYITGAFFGSGYIMKSTDQGDTWTYLNMQNLCNGLVDIYFQDENIGFAAGQSAQGTGLRGIIIRTIDGGQTWSEVALGANTNERVWKIQPLNENILYASVESFTPSPEYFKSSDAGLTWELKSVTSSGISGTIQGVGFLNEDIGWVGGFSDFFYETTDEGENWEYKPTIGSSFNRFQRINDTLMYTSGVNIYKYTNPELLNIDEFEIVKPTGHNITIKHSNVIDGITKIELALVNNTYCELSVYNTNGQRLQTISKGKRLAGEYDFSYDVSNLTNGQYYLVLYTYFGYQSIKFVVK